MMRWLFRLLWVALLVVLWGCSTAAPMSPELLALSADLRENPRVAAGFDFVLAVKDGKVYGWGTNRAVLIDKDGAQPSWDKPVVIPIPEDAFIVSVSGGIQHGVALDAGGRVWVWGNNKWGGLGIKDRMASWEPRNIDLSPEIKSISADGGNTLALAEDGSVWAWGSNKAGKAAGVLTEEIVGPHKVNGLPIADAIYVAGLNSFVIAGNDLYVWGASLNRISSLMRSGYREDAPNRIFVPCNVTNIDALVSIMFVCSDGGVFAIGYSGSVLGMGFSHDVKILTKHPYLSHVLKVTGKEMTRLALTSEGSVYGWGDNAYGVSEFTNSFEKRRPVRIKQLKKIVDISSEGFNAFIVTNDGKLLRWRVKESRFIKSLYYFFGRYYFEPLKDESGQDFKLF